MEPARCCLADCYFQSCYLSLALAHVCLEKLARQSHFAALINIVHYARAVGGLVWMGSGWGWWVVSISWGSTLKKRWERIWVVDYMCSSFYSPPPTHPSSGEKKKHVKAVLFHLHQNQFPLLPLVLGMQAKQWQRNYKQGDFLLHFCLPSLAVPACLIEC